MCTRALSTLIGLLFFNISIAQVVDLDEKTPVTLDGFEYGYIIKNEQVKSAGGEEYSRFELTLFITNKSGCTRMYKDKSGAFSYGAPNLLATFQIRNANGKRLTSKSSDLRARDFYITVKRKATEKEKESSESVKAGYIFRNGETVRGNIIVLVPKGEKPEVQCITNSPEELN